jgi:hypothetical protein
MFTRVTQSKTSVKDHIKQLVYNLETMSMNSEHAQDDNIVWICDFQGWTVSTTPLWESRESLHIIQNYYPGLIAAAILSNPPKIFESFWKVFVKFMPMSQILDYYIFSRIPDFDY